MRKKKVDRISHNHHWQMELKDGLKGIYIDKCEYCGEEVERECSHETISFWARLKKTKIIEWASDSYSSIGYCSECSGVVTCSTSFSSYKMVIKNQQTIRECVLKIQRLLLEEPDYLDGVDVCLYTEEELKIIEEENKREYEKNEEKLRRMRKILTGRVTGGWKPSKECIEKED